MFPFFKKRGVPLQMQEIDLASADLDTRARLAASADTDPSALEHLTRDSEALVREAAARNTATPVIAAARLATDDSARVRLALAERLVTLLPNLPVDRHSQLYAYTVQALGVLAQDEVLKIRLALSTALKDSAHTPPQVAAKLARDIERAVSEPILHFCAALPDDDLLDILSGHPEPWVVSAIARRDMVSESVAAAVIDVGDVPAGTALLNNPGARISEKTLEEIVDRARSCPEWRAPAALRKDLSSELAEKLAGFVDREVMSLLEERDDLPPRAQAEIARIVNRRIAYAGDGGSPQERLARHTQEGGPATEVITDALSWQDYEFVTLALAWRAGIPATVAARMLKSGFSRPIIALCWKAGVPMRLAVDIQRHMARLLPKDVIYARGGTDYPLTRDEMLWQLEFFGVSSEK